MTTEIIKQIKETVLNNLPKEARITNVEVEGPEVAIYTQNPKAFFENENLIAKVAFELKKRVNLRTDKSLLLEQDKAEKKIKEIVPIEADIKSIAFNPAFSEVVIESIKPGLVIGKGGETSKRIIIETGWVPSIIRAPTSPSEILAGIRHHLNKYSAERKKILQHTAEQIYKNPPSPNKWIRLTALGSFREVGRSCMMVETQDTRVLLDCGINPANPEEPFPYLDVLRFPIQEIDAIIISHAHLDHGGFLPYLFKLGYRGPVYCTLPTRDLMALLDFDFIDVFVKEGKEAPYSEADVKEMVKHCITREYREVTDIAPDMRLTFHNAAHILGSASVHLHIGEGAHNLVYSADLKYGFTRLFNNIDINYPRMETLILESTYAGKGDMPERQDSEERLVSIIRETVNQGGNVLIPVFAVGRAQEIMLVVEEFYRRGALEAKVFVDGMTKEASAIHTAYPEYLRKGVQRRVLQNDSPFTSELFQLANHKNRQEILDNGGAVILASSGMLTGGASVDYFYRMASNPKNCLLFVGYQAEGSMGKKIQAGVSSIPVVENGKTKSLEIKMRVETVEGFSGHSFRNELLAYLRNVKPRPKRILVNHGDSTVEFSKFIANRFRINTTAMRNLDAIRLR
ncbi:MAG: beta-CASP ribonuclease aCPSF1 [Candidatus Diapherotrites archaeon]|uniref:Transcription termination factor FttA n=1 Tax=Candidatus Iainarchaeum sp. TaxID=3101447 RepID=A0A7J4KSL3_9ARCH|nr:beta-CASP ribonuclease aCPSF1 [Candidatus Diapherotrites archaeon]HIH33021.1 beta-CASP ribonuclease aCPSF1 [Candidatus Diapherotrites archaeon]